jgi:hypothetical protein
MKRRSRWLTTVGTVALAVLAAMSLFGSNLSAKPPGGNPCPQCPPICQNGLRCQVSACGFDCVYTCWLDPSCH